MKNTDITGGVSPLKVRQKTRGGKAAGRATATDYRRGGFAASKGSRGAGGRNVGGYNVRTRFKADKWVRPPSSGSTTPNPQKPYSYAPGGGVTINNVNTQSQQQSQGEPGEQSQSQTPGAGEQFRTLKAEAASTGNRFYDACHDADGNRLAVGSKGTTTWVDENGETQTKSFDCTWGGKGGSGVHDYNKEATSERKQRRTYKTDPEGNIIPDSYTTWEDYKDNIVKK